MKSLLHQLAFGIWCFRPDVVGAYMPQVSEVIFGNHILSDLKSSDAPRPTPVVAVPRLEFQTLEGERLALDPSKPVDQQDGLVAVISISGPIMRDDFCGDAGMLTMAKWYADIENTPGIVGIVEDMNSPGGNGQAMLALTTQKERMRKPIISLVRHGMACSAAQGITAASDLTFASTELDEFGSIGTYVKIADWDAAYAKRNDIKVHTIKATRSVQKNADVESALKADPADPKDNYDALRKNYIDPFNEAFIALVQRNRPGVKDENGVLEGRVFMAKEALKYGLIDSTGETLESAIAAVRDIANKKTKN